MVVIIDHRKAFLDMLAWSEELITTLKNQKSQHDVIVGGELFTDYLITLANGCRQNPNSNCRKRRTLPASFPLVGCLPQAAWPERLLPKVRTLWHCSRLGERGALPMIDRGDIRQAPTAAGLSGPAGRWLYCLSIKAGQPDCKIQRSGRNGQRD